MRGKIREPTLPGGELTATEQFIAKPPIAPIPAAFPFMEPSVYP